MVINLQTTPLDYACKLRIFAKCDDVSKMLMSKLGLEIPEFRLKRYVLSLNCSLHINPTDRELHAILCLESQHYF